jgi:dCTP deaminase
MILSGRDIKWYMDQGKLIIQPVEEIQFQQNGIDLVLEEIQDQAFKTNINPKYLSIQRFYLGRTREYFEMPDDLMAFVQLRSTWARRGILLPPTVVDAGFKGTLTLEIFNLMEQESPVGQRFGHLIFAKMTGPSSPYSGKYQGQIAITGPIKDK